MEYNMKNFITEYINADIKNGKYVDLAFRFPPEPNGYLHLGHAKSIVVNSLLAKKYGAKLYLRLDDTNPETEKEEYVLNIIEDSNWLTLKEFDAITYTSDYFDKLYEIAVELIKRNLAYVDFSTEEEIKLTRGGFNNSDKETKYRNESIETNLINFEKMKNGIFKDGEAVLRAKINLSHKNMNMRDPIMYRIKHAYHYRTKNKWCIYPMYDYAHPLSDVFEKISHSLCTLEFEDHKVLYNWYVEMVFPILNWRPTELEFSRLEMENTTLSKRKLLKIVEEEKISWNDERMPTISGIRKKGITPEIIIDYILKCGVSKVNSLIPELFLNESIRNINKKAEKIFAILEPIELIFINGNDEFYNSVFIEKKDVKEKEEIDFWRVFPGNTVRLKNGYNFNVTKVKTNEEKIYAEIDFNSKNLKECGIKPRGVIHWLGKYRKIKAVFCNSLLINGEFNKNSMIESEILIDENFKTNTIYEFERLGYFYINEDGVAYHLAWLKNSLFSCE